MKKKHFLQACITYVHMSTKKDTNFVCSFEDEMKLKDTFQDLSAFKYRRFGTIFNLKNNLT